MSDLSANTKSKLDFNAQTDDQSPMLEDNLRAQKTDSQRKKISGLGSIRISTPAKKIEAELSDEDMALGLSAQDLGKSEDNTGEVNFISSAFFIMAIVWVAYSFGYFIQDGIDTAPQDLAILFGTLLAPPALLWYIISQFRSKGRSQSNSFNPAEFSGDVAAFYAQAEEIAQMTKAVLKSLQRARQGLRVEMRDFSGVSKKAEFHIERLAEALHSKNEKIVDIASQIEEKVNVIDEKAQNSTKSWDEAVQRLSDRGAEIEREIMNGAEKILEAADKAHLKTNNIKDTMQDGFDGLNDAVEQIASRLDGINSRFEGHTDSINEIVDHVAVEAERLTDTIKGQIDDLEASAGRAVASVIGSAETITIHKEKMEGGIRELYTQSERVSDLVKRSVDELKDCVDYVSGNAGLLEERLEKRSTSLKEAVDSISKQADLIEEVGDHAANKLGESLSVAVGGAESISFAIKRAVDALEEGHNSAKDRANKIMNDVSSHISELNNEAANNARIIEKASDALSMSNTALNSSVSEANDKVGTLIERLEAQSSRMDHSIKDLSGSVSSVGNTLAESIRDIQSAVTDVDSRHHVIESVISRRVEDLNSASDRALKVVEDIRSGLRGQVQEIASLTGQLSSQGRSANDAMMVQKEQLEQAAEKALHDVERVSQALKEQISQVQEASSLSGRELNDIVSNVSGHYEQLQAFGKQAENSLESLDGLLMSKLSSLYDQSDRAKESFSGLSAQLAESTQSLAPACDFVIEKVGQVEARFNNLREECTAVSESNLHKFQQFGIVLEEGLTDLKAGSDQAASMLDGVNDVIKQRAEYLRDTSNEAVSNVKKAADGLRDQAETIHLLGDQSVMKMDTVQKEMNAQFMDFSESVASAVLELEKAGDSFVRQSSSAQSEVQDTINVLKTAGVKAREEVFMISEAAQKVAGDTEEVISGLEGRTQDLLSSAQIVLSDFKKTGDTLSIRARELSEQMRASLQTSEMYGREIKGQVSAIAGSSIEVAEQIGKAVALLNTSMDNIGRTAHDTADHISVARDNLSVEADRIMQVSSAALETTKDAAEGFAGQSEAMFKAVRDMQDAASKINAHQAKSERTALLSSSRFIIESLHSLSVDVARMLEGGDVSEKSWQAFQRGDVSVFTRKLAALGSEWPIERAQDKFRKDSEFRTYVSRFIRQFEEVYEQASTNDHGALLSVTIASSDIAKLYEKLCQIALRENKIARLADRTAA